MCDFAADAKAAEELMVGRTLTVARVRELNAKDYFYQMLKDNPEMLKIYPGIENELLQGAIDCHIHAFPDFVHRSQDMIQIAIEASKTGMRAIAFKDHWNISATSAYLTQRHIDDMIARGELTHRVEVYGGVGMCFGMRPEYVRVGLQYPNFKMIWFPTFTSYGFWRGAGHPDHEGVRLCSENGQVLPEVKQIMEMAAEKKSVWPKPIPTFFSTAISMICFTSGNAWPFSLHRRTPCGPDGRRPPEAVRSKSRKPDHLEVGIL